MTSKTDVSEKSEHAFVDANPADAGRTEVGNYFVSNYPLYSYWQPEQTPAAFAALEAAPRPDDPLGLYIHIPFCRKRCEFCYFKVYTDKNATQIEDYIAALVREMEIYGAKPAMQDRKLRFVYFGGGTPSYLSEKQLHHLVDGLDRHVSWSDAEEFTFECEPGTLRKSKLEAIKAIGVTRLSLGVENFSDDVLKWNGRAHLSPEIARSYGWAREVDFKQINIDLIAGMIGETEDNWQMNIAKTIEMEPDSITIYQMELPFNTEISQEIRDSGITSPIADWDTKRRWVDYAFDEFLKAGYEIISAYTVVRKGRGIAFDYTRSLWHGADMLGLGVASLSHFGGVHFQNVHGFNQYVSDLGEGRLPIFRALSLTDKQLLIREMILQLKTGRIELGYFREKFGADIWSDFESEYQRLADEQMLERKNGSIELTRKGLLQADGLLPGFFEPGFGGVHAA